MESFNKINWTFYDLEVCVCFSMSPALCILNSGKTHQILSYQTTKKQSKIERWKNFLFVCFFFAFFFSLRMKTFFSFLYLCWVFFIPKWQTNKEFSFCIQRKFSKMYFSYAIQCFERCERQIKFMNFREKL